MRTVGRALAFHLAQSTLRSATRIAANEVVAAIQRSDLQVAQAMLQDMAVRHRDMYEEFLEKYRDELPSELFD